MFGPADLEGVVSSNGKRWYWIDPLEIGLIRKFFSGVLLVCFLQDIWAAMDVTTSWTALACFRLFPRLPGA
jgi:hypothetical protein